jgi:hypothetical protein
METSMSLDSSKFPKTPLDRILEHSERVAKAFGRRLGFVVIMTAMVLSAGFTAGVLYTAGKAALNVFK